MADALDPFALLGLSIDAPTVQSLITQYALVDEFAGVVDEVRAGLLEDADNDLSVADIDAVLAQMFPNGEHHSARYSNLDRGLIVSFSRSSSTGTRMVDSVCVLSVFVGEFPLGLTADTDYKTVALGTRIRKGKDYYGTYSAAFIEDACIVTVMFDEDKTFNTVTFAKLDETTATQITFFAELPKQKENLVAGFDSPKRALLAAHPVLAWRERQHDDPLFTDANLEEAERAVVAFLEAVEVGVQKRSPTLIVNAAKAFTRAFNKINRRYESCVETSEREELCAFVDQTLRATGLTMPEGFDITFEWRDW